MSFYKKYRNKLNQLIGYTPVGTKFKVNGATTNDGNVIPNKFNSFFVNVGTVLAKSIPPTDKNPVDYIQQDILGTLYCDPVTENEICKIIGSFKDSAAGWDDLKSSMIKHIKESIIVPLVHICNRSFVTSIFPIELKIANIVPI